MYTYVGTHIGREEKDDAERGGSDDDNNGDLEARNRRRKPAQAEKIPGDRMAQAVSECKRTAKKFLRKLPGGKWQQQQCLISGNNTATEATEVNISGDLPNAREHHQNRYAERMCCQRANAYLRLRARHNHLSRRDLR